MHKFKNKNKKMTFQIRIKGLTPCGTIKLGLSMHFPSLFPPPYKTLFRVFLSPISQVSWIHLNGPITMARAP